MFRHLPRIMYPVLLSTSAVAQEAASFQGLSDALEQARREAVRPGDEQLDCPALEQQFIAAATSPSLHDYVDKGGAQAQRDAARAQPDPARMTAQAALTAFSSLVPGGAWAGLLAQAGEMAGMQAQTAQNVQQRVQQANEMVKILPQLLRGQRVIELAQARRCEWVPAEVMKPDAGTPGRK